MKNTLLSALLTVIAAIGMLVVGCKTTDWGAVITPARVQSVTALGAYLGGREIVKQGNADQLRQAVQALTALQAAGNFDGPAIVSILEATDLKDKLETSEGILILGTVLSFSDLWTGHTVEIVESEYYQAVVAGLIRGFDLALGPSMASVRTADPIAAKLLDEAIATRPKKR